MVFIQYNYDLKLYMFFFYKHRGAKHRRPEIRPKVKHLLSIVLGRNLNQKLSIYPCGVRFAKISPAAT